MYLTHTPEMTFDAMAKALEEGLPQYQVSLKKNPALGFQYVQVKKTGAVGIWVRVFPKKNQVSLIRCMPSPWVRGLFGGLLLLAFVSGAQGKVQKEVAEVLKNKFNTN